MYSIPKKYKFKAKRRGNKYWSYFTARKRAERWAGSIGVVRKRSA